MRVLFFGTYDEDAHPRVRVLREGIAAHGHDVTVCNVPLPFDTAARVRLASQPWRLPGFVGRLLVAWLRLLVRSRGIGRPDLVVVGYLGVFDVHLARLRFGRSTIALDQMVTLGGTVRDRALTDEGRLARMLDRLDHAAARRADVVVVDTQANARALPPDIPSVTVPVGAPDEWFRARADAPAPDDPVRVVFFGLYTPLQGATTIGSALSLLDAADNLAVSMIGTGQDRKAAQEASRASGIEIDWIDWIDASDLPAVVASHHVCLGIFGTTDKALQVVPNKVFQGAAAGAAIITSESETQRAALGDAATLVPPGDPLALAAALRAFASDGEALAAARRRASSWADRHSPARVVEPLLDTLESA